MWTDTQFWKDSTWRAFRTFCQTLAALLGGQAVSIISADWVSTLSVAGTASLISLLQSIDRGRATAAEAATIDAKLSTALPSSADYQPAAAMAAGPGCGGDMR